MKKINLDTMILDEEEQEYERQHDAYVPAPEGMRARREGLLRKSLPDPDYRTDPGRSYSRSHSIRYRWGMPLRPAKGLRSMDNTSLGWLSLTDSSAANSRSIVSGPESR